MPGNRENLIGLLRDRGTISGGTLVRELGISRSTFSRLIAVTPEVIRFGAPRNTAYGLLRELPGIGATIPLFRVDKTGDLEPVGNLFSLHANSIAIEPGRLLFDGLPPEIGDMVPQGFLGRVFAKQNMDLGLPRRLQDWSDEHQLIALARRGEDTPGNVIVGEESAERWQSKVIDSVTRDDYLTLAEKAIAGQVGESSAGGEQPKFTALVEGRHCLTKFAAGDSLASQRWWDLLACEEVALTVLNNANITTARASLHTIRNTRFLEVERFDRIGTRGRLPTITLAAIDNHLYGKMDTWSAAADRLHRGKFISEKDATTIRLLEAFARMIGNTDRHFYNVAFHPRGDQTNFLPKKYELAPVFDQLPMLFAPIDGQVRDEEFTKPVPGPFMLDVWKEARNYALNFWSLVIEADTVSKSFKKLAEKAARMI